MLSKARSKKNHSIMMILFSKRMNPRWKPTWSTPQENLNTEDTNQKKKETSQELMLR